MKRFAVLYRGYLRPGKEAEYIECWKIISSYFVAERGAIGSTLHKTEEGMWVAYSRWPDRKTRDSSWPKDGEDANSELPEKIRDAIIEIKSCLDPERPLPEIAMEIVEET